MIKRIGIFCLFTLYCISSFSQEKKQRNCTIEENTARCYKIPYIFEKIAEIENYHSFLANYFPNKQFVLKQKIESPAAIHLHFEQQFNNTPIFHATLQLNIAKNGKLISVVDNTFSIEKWQRIYGEQALNACNFPQEMISARQNMIIVIDEKPYFAIWYAINTKPMPIEIVIADDENIYQRNRGSFFTTDSTVAVKVFNPDPITTAHGVYGGQLVDNNDATNSTLNNLRVDKTVTARFVDTAFFLTNNYFEFIDIDNNGVNPPVVSSPLFNFTRNQTAFEYVNTYYHINTIRNYISSLGFSTADHLVKADPHGTTDDNSFFMEPDQLTFGTGGIDDAEDADVIVHEFTHFLSYNASPGTNWGAQRGAIDEAYGDYFATSYSRSIDDYNWMKMFSWDGNSTWSGRIVQGTKAYPADVSSDMYKTSAIISQCLNDIWTDIGRAAADSIFLQSMYLTGANASLTDYANNLLDADNILTNGRYQCSIFNRLYARGLVTGRMPGCNVGIAETAITTNPFSLLQNSDGFIIVTEKNDFMVKIYSINGDEILTEKNIKSVNMTNFSKGIYIITFEANGSQYHIKYNNY